MGRIVALMLCAVALASCNKPPPPQGDEGQACYPNDTCNVGLACVSGRCEGPGVDCGNTICDANETALSCPQDCGAGTCGDGVVDSDINEACDGTDFAGQTCLSLGHLGGTLACDADCADFDEGGCHSCGDSIIQIPEICDISNLGGITCRDVGFESGQLQCTADCLAYDTSGCTNTCEEVDCATCINSPCAQSICSAELATCNANVDCLALYQCLISCVDDLCEIDCYNASPLGVDDYLATQGCLVCNPDVCYDECDGLNACP